MFRNLSVKNKLIGLITISLFIISLILTVLTIKQTNAAVVHDKYVQLSSIQEAKKGEILNYFSYLKALVTSLANNEGTKSGFEELQKGFYLLDEELSLDISSVKSKLKKDFETNYLESVNYLVPNSEQKKDIDEYLPNNNNALTAQYIFITENNAKLGEKNALTYNPNYDSTYMQAHKKYHESFDSFLTSYELYDIFMVDLQGNLIYTDFKEKDFATNLKTGVYSNTGLGKVYKKALNIGKGEIAFEDFTAYEPSYNTAASFLASPIFINGQKKGVLIFQMPVEKINNIMHFNEQFNKAGLGKTGDAYLVGQDFKMRSNSRFQTEIKDDVVQAVGTTIGVWEIKTDSTQKALKNNETGTNILVNYKGENTLSSYTPLNIFDQVKWALIVEEAEDEILVDAVALRNNMIVISIVIFIISVLIALIVINKQVIKPIEQFTDYLEEFLNFISYKQNRIEKKSIKSEKNEFSEMMEKLNTSVDDFDGRFKNDMKVLGEIVLIMDKVESGSYRCRVKSTTQNPMITTLKNTINKMLDTVARNMDQLQQTVGSYEKNDFKAKVDIDPKIQGRMKNIMEGVNNLGLALSNGAKENLENGQSLEQNSSIMKSAMNNLATKANEQAASLEETAAALEEITSITRNNAQNAAKMATLGSTVKSAVSNGQNLASKTASSMDEINEKVTSINEAITVIDQIAFQTNILSLNAAVEAATAGEAGKGFAVVAAEVRNLASRSADAAKEIKAIVESATSKANEGKDISDEMIKGYVTLNEHMTETIHIIEEVSTSSREQITGIEQINDTINMLDKVTQENASDANQITSIANDVSTMAHKLVEEAKTKKF